MWSHFSYCRRSINIQYCAPGSIWINKEKNRDTRLRLAINKHNYDNGNITSLIAVCRKIVTRFDRLRQSVGSRRSVDLSPGGRVGHGHLAAVVSGCRANLSSATFGARHRRVKPPRAGTTSSIWPESEVTIFSSVFPIEITIITPWQNENNNKTV